MPKKKTSVETGAGYESQNPFVQHQPDTGQSHGEAGQDTSLERGESVEGSQIPSNADPLDTSLMRDPDPHNPNTPDHDLNDSAPRTGLGMDGEVFDDVNQENENRSSRETLDGSSGEDEENQVQDGYGSGRMMQGVDIDAPGDAGTFGNPNQPDSTRKLSGNER